MNSCIHRLRKGDVIIARSDQNQCITHHRSLDSGPLWRYLVTGSGHNIQLLRIHPVHVEGISVPHGFLPTKSWLDSYVYRIEKAAK